MNGMFAWEESGQLEEVGGTSRASSPLVPKNNPPQKYGARPYTYSRLVVLVPQVDPNTKTSGLAHLF